MVFPGMLDGVRLDTGETGTVIEVFDNGAAYMIEIADENGCMIDDPIVEADRIVEITYRHSTK